VEGLGLGVELVAPAVDPAVPPLGEPDAPPLAEPAAPPLAEPDALASGLVSLVPDPLAAELEELGLEGVAEGVDEALPVPPAEPDAEPEAEPDAPGDEGLVLGDVALLEEPEPEVCRPLSGPRSHAARPKASATAAAKIESFMCPPWVG
jgi:hypothetical protein